MAYDVSGEPIIGTSGAYWLDDLPDLTVRIAGVVR
jgi:hypothetical protein